MKEVTKELLEDLICKFHKYTETAEHHEFLMLALVQMRIEGTDITEIVKNQKEARAMYRVIAKTIGADYSDFVE